MENGLKLFDDLLEDQAKLDDKITGFSGQMEEYDFELIFNVNG